MRVPDEVTQADLKEARKWLLNRKGIKASMVKRVCWREGRSLQVMHTGPHREKKETYKKLREKAEELGYRVRGPAHEIHISNPQKTAPGKSKKIIRLPIAWPRPQYAQSHP